MKAKVGAMGAFATGVLLSSGVPALAQVASVPGSIRDVASVNVLSAPEGGSAWLYLLLAAAACCGAMFVGYRRRTGKPNAAMNIQPLSKQMS